MLREVAALLLLAIINDRSVCKDVFTSTAQLSDLLATKEVEKIANRYINKANNNLVLLKQKLALLDEARLSLKTDEPLSEHVIGTYHILRAYSAINATIHDLNNFIENQGKTSSEIPNAEDLAGASRSIVRLQHTYNLPIDDIIRGRIVASPYKALTPREAFMIGKTAFEELLFEAAASWMTSIYKIYGHVIDGDLRKDVLMHLAYCYERFPDVQSLQKTLQLLFKLYRDDPDLNAYYNKVDDILIRTAGTAIGTDLSDLDRYRALCRGETLPDVETLSDVEAVCRYRPVRAPYDRVKEEVLCLAPYVLFYYDVVTDSEIIFMKNKAQKTLQTSMVGISILSSSTSKVRTSKTAWLFDKDNEDPEKRVARISARIGLITGLSHKQRRFKSDCEATQVVNYGIGGQYEPHLDTSPGTNHSSNGTTESLRGSGDRIATFLIYLSDVQMGGATVFPRAGLKVDPVKNGAVFWYNMLPSGAYDWLTLHAGCPVVLGEKWIANKWFRAKGQTFRRPCGLNFHTRQEHLKLAHDRRFTANTVRRKTSN